MAGNLEVTDLPTIPAVEGADVYAAKNNLDYRIRTGEAGGLATLDGTGKLAPVQRWSIAISDVSGLTTALNGKYNTTGGLLTGDMTFFTDTPTIQMMSPAGVTATGRGYEMVSNVADSTDFGFGLNRWNGVSWDNVYTIDSTRTLLYNGAINVANGNIVTVRTTRNDSIYPFRLTDSTGATSWGGLYTPFSGGIGIKSAISLAAIVATDGAEVFCNTNFRATGTMTATSSLSAAGITTTNSLNIHTSVGTINFYPPAGAAHPNRWAMFANISDTVNGGIGWTNAGVNKMVLDSGGVLTATNFVATSDEDLKTDIKDRKARERLPDLLRFVEFIWKADGKEDLGVIAQEVQKVAPEYVHEGIDGKLAVDKASLALECVIGLAARVRALEGGE